MLLCPDCAGTAPSLLIEGTCPHCGWKLERRSGVPVMLSRAHQESAIFGEYSRNYEEIASDDLADGIQDSRQLEFFAQRLHGYLGDLRGRDVCDVGIGQGKLFERIRLDGPASLTGVDIAMPYLERFSSNGSDPRTRVLMANAENLPFEDEFDVLVAADVLEHVLNAGDFLLTANRALHPGGRLVVRVPYAEDLTGYSRLKGSKYELVHLRDFDERNLERMLRSAGLELVEFRYDGFLAYRRRRFLDKSRRLRNYFARYVAKHYPDPFDLYRMREGLGRRLMIPLTITAVARKPELPR